MLRNRAQIISVGFALVVDAQFSTRKLQFVQKLFAFSAVEVENGDRLSAGGANLPGKQERAEVISRRHVPFARTDKNSALFARRNLRVLSWVGHNILGNRDGLVLNDPDNKASKLRSKDAMLAELLGYRPQTHVSIEYIESLDDWKTAWDHIHFEGFLGTKMTLQFTWQGCDSLLAAPLVLDLTRLTLLAARRGESGPLRHLACFFKSPEGVEEHDFFKQFHLLATHLRSKPAPEAAPPVLAPRLTV